ncbi:ABA4-like family protein [Umezawaea sp.]|uniref:ABA4-like family protein n=1 Tax=Umezawaea sp. TaxID=1955258 RepID=UPI002ECFEF4F
MTEVLFSTTFLLAVPFWALMILAPRWRTTEKVIASPLIVVPPALVYLVLAVANLPELWAAVSAPALGPLAEFLGTPEGTALGWAHFIAWDLFVGRWMYRQSRGLGVHPLVMAPILLVTILASPIGLLLFLPVRALRARRAEPALTV